MRCVIVLLAIAACACTVACDDGGGGGSYSPANTTAPRVTVNLTPIVPGNGAPYDGVPSERLTLGASDALVTIDVWSNFICASCVAFALETLPSLVTKYVAQGTARFVFHHAPLGGAPAIRAHEASECAADQGRFWPAFAQISANFSQQSEAYSAERLSAMMANAGLDVAAFDECLADGEHREEIEAAVVDFGEVQRLPNAGFAAATATAQGRSLLPVVIINNRPIVAPTLDEMRATIDGIIEEELP